MLAVILFIFGLAVGSFLNVVALRYDPDSNRSVFSLKPIGGRSRCPGCAVTLNWYDLIPVLSSVMLRRKCRSCQALISFQYPFAEIIAGFIALVPLYFYNPIFPELSLALGIIWTLAFYIFLLLSLINFRFLLIPDELNIVIAALGSVKVGALYIFDKFDLVFGTFLGGYAQIFGLRENIFYNHTVAAIFGALFFGTIIYVTRGRGMGMGDFKMAIALGLLLGWPDIIISIFLSFILGSIYSIYRMIFSGLQLKDAVPFGPFIVLGVIANLFFGEEIMRVYFTVFGV